MMRKHDSEDEWTPRKATFLEQKAGGALAFLAAIALIGVILWIAFSQAHGAQCKLAWDANDPRENITEYRVYLGTLELARVTTATAEVLLPNAPCEVAVVAVQGSLQSPPATLKLAYVDIIDQGDNLLNTRILPGRHVEYWPGRRFYKGRIQVPP